jgi:hypothetical protein
MDLSAQAFVRSMAIRVTVTHAYANIKRLFSVSLAHEYCVRAIELIDINGSLVAIIFQPRFKKQISPLIFLN